MTTKPLVMTALLATMFLPAIAGAQDQAQPQWVEPTPAPQPQYAPPMQQQQHASPPQQGAPPPQQAAHPVQAAPAPVDRGDMRDWPAMAHVLVRLGHFMPFGDLEERVSLGDASSGMTMFFLGGGARIGKFVFDLEFGIGGSGLRGDLHHAIEDQGYDPHGFIGFLFGIEGTYYIQRGSNKAVWPFVGLGLEYEALITGGDSGGINYYRAYDSFQLRPMVGVDFPLASAFALGVALEMGLGSYGDIAESTYPDDDILTPENESVVYEVKSETPSGAGMHGWVGISARIILLP